jgi:hypothetical protein
MTFNPDDIGDLEEGDTTRGDNGRLEDEAEGDEGSSVELWDGIALHMWGAISRRVEAEAENTFLNDIHSFIVLVYRFISNIGVCNCRFKIRYLL